MENFYVIERNFCVGGADLGRDARVARPRLGDADARWTKTRKLAAGDYPVNSAAVRDAIHGTAANPAPASEALAV